MPEPVNKKLYEEVKAEVYAKYPKNSAYRSGLLVQEYKRRGGTYEGSESRTEGLNRWMSEKWLNQRGEVGYKYKSDIHRPTIKVTQETPLTFQELTQKEIEQARREKANKGRVNRFKSTK